MVFACRGSVLVSRTEAVDELTVSLWSHPSGCELSCAADRWLFS